MADVCDSLSFHRAALAGSRSRSIRYWRGSAYVDLSDVVMGATPIGFALSNTLIQSWRSTDFLIPVASLALNGREISPEKGDRVEVSLNGETVRFVVAQTDDQRCFRYSDAVARKTFRVHTREAA